MIDLHMHSLFSDDGEFAPKELADRCCQAGITIFSITDHNCVKANLSAAEAAKAAGLSYLTGVEIDCIHENRDFHLLGYGIDPKTEVFRQIEANVAWQNAKASQVRWEKLGALGLWADEKALEKLTRNAYWKKSWTGELLAEVLLADPAYAHHPLLKPYRPGGGRSDNPYVNFYWDFCAQGKPCFVQIKYPAMAAVIGAIHQCNGLAVLAHPGVNLRGIEEVECLISLGLDGLEAFSSYHNPGQAIFFYETALAHNLGVTCGSDYHGKTKPAVQLGRHGCPFETKELRQQFPRLFQMIS